MDIKEAADTDAAAQSETADPGHVRRRVLAVGITGAVASLLPFLRGQASAAGDSGATASTTGDPFDPDNTEIQVTSDANGTTVDTTVGTENASGQDSGSSTPETNGQTDASVTDETGIAATTTTAPPRKPDAADIEVLGFLQTVELTIRDLYDVALKAKVFEALNADDITAIREAHEGYSQAISGLIGRHAPNHRSDVLFGTLQSQFIGSARTVATNAATLENAAIATHIEGLAEIKATDAAALIASILVVEARHATVLNTFAGASDLEAQLNDDGVAISAADFPVG